MPPHPSKGEVEWKLILGMSWTPVSRRIAHEIHMTSLFCPTTMVNWSFSNAGRPWTNGRVNCYCHPNPLLFLIWKRRNYPKSRLTYLRNIEAQPFPGQSPNVQLLFSPHWANISAPQLSLIWTTLHSFYSNWREYYYWKDSSWPPKYLREME